MAKKTGEPHQIGRYEIRRELGRGVMGVVYQAWDTILGRTIALKTIKPVADSAEQREAWERRFLIEAQAAARLSHPAIVVVYDVGRDPDTDILYIALEYLDGQSLAQRSGPGRPLPWRDTLRIVSQVAEGLHHAHTQGVIHRDIKPANVMVVPSGDAKILDFGVARLDEGSLTNPGDLCGTPLYMSPEQASGHALDARSDIFSLGAVAWTLLTGQSPFEAPTVSAILMRVMHKSPAAPSEIVPGIPRHVDEILARALAKMPEDRYPDARQLAEDVEDALADRVPRHRAEWNPTATGERTRVSLVPPPKAGRRSRRVWLSAALLLGLAVSARAHFAAHPEDQWFWLGMARRAAASAPADALRAWLHPTAAVTPPAAAAATAWPDASAPPVLLATPATLPDSPTGGAAEGETSAPPLAPEAAAARPDDTATATSPAAGSGPLEPPVAPPTAPPDLSATSASRGAEGGPSPPVTSPVVPRARDQKAAAYLSIGFQHRLKGGTLEVWVDGARVASKRLDMGETLRLEPGRREIKVRVRTNGKTRSARTTALFRVGTTRRLEISLSRVSGRIALVWR